MSTKLPLEIFLKTFELVPRLAFNLIIENHQGGVLLTKREIPPEVGLWHFPGGFLLKGEKIEECLTRIAKAELGLDLQTSDLQLLGIFEDLDQDPRGHVVDVAYGYILEENLTVIATKENQAVEFFAELPAEMGFNHRETLLKLGYQ